MNQSFSKIWVLIILIILIAGGVLAWQYFGIPFGIPKEEKITTPEEKIMYKEIDISCCGAPPSYRTMKIGLKESSLSGWNTLTIYEYDGYKVGFSIDYPLGYKISYGAVGDAPICAKFPVVMFFSPEKREIPGYGEKEMIRIDIDSCVELGWAATFQEWIDYMKGGRYPVEKEENIIVDSEPAIKLVDTVSRILPAPDYKELLVYVYINRDEEVAHEITADIDFEEQSTYLPIFNQMLSSFRFVEEELPERGAVQKQISECEELEDSLAKGICYENIAISEKDINICEKAIRAAPSLCKYCPVNVAEALGRGPEFCKSAKLTFAKIDCYCMLAESAKDLELMKLCKDLKENHDSATYEIAKGQEDADICDGIENLNLQNQCKDELRIKIETADWKIYRNEEFGFEIKHPSSFFTQDDANGIEFIEEQWIGEQVHYPFIGIEFIKTPLAPQQWIAEKGTEVSLVEEPPPGFQVSKYSYFGVGGKEVKTIGAFQFFQFYSAGVSGFNNNAFIQQKDNALINIYRHTSGAGEVSKDIYNQMLSTFRFLE